MPSFTSSFDRLVPEAHWLRIFTVAIGICVGFVICLELYLSRLGYSPTSVDSELKWLRERARASHLAGRALIVIGGSRIMLGLDPDTLREETGLEPVQLAIDGNSFGPILAGLAADPSVRGLVLADHYNVIFPYPPREGDLYERHYAKRWELGPSARVELVLEDFLRDRLRSYADGATPLFWLRTRVLGAEHSERYLTTLPNRFRIADYSRLDMPKRYFRRVLRELKINLDANAPDVEAILRRELASIRALDNRRFLEESRIVRRMVAEIEGRGGKVAFVKMPISGMLGEIEERKYPRARFWDRFIDVVGAPGIHFADSPALSAFVAPDGSHLDARDRACFTAALVQELRRRGVIP